MGGIRTGAGIGGITKGAGITISDIGGATATGSEKNDS